MSLKNAQWLKKRRRQNKIKKQTNYVNKTHKGVDINTLRDNLKRKKIEKVKEKKNSTIFWLWFFLINKLSKLFRLDKNQKEGKKC